MPTCAIYARVSDESQVKGDSIEHQISFSREFARRKSNEENVPWATPDSLVYIDEGITGTSLVKRPAVQRLIQDSRQQRFDVVLFKGISRFARDTVDALLMLRTLLACGVRVVSMEENFDSRRDNAEFVFTIHSALAQAESEKTAIRVRMGAMEKAKSGKWNGAVPDGYVLNADTKRLEIDQSFAPVIVKIFDMYLHGLGSIQIASALHKDGWFTKRGNEWNHRNISRLLQNPVYVGDVVYGRREQKLAIPDENDPLSRKKVAVPVDDPSQIVVARDAHPGIVSREVFEQVQDTMQQRRTRRGRSGKLRLLTRGILRCTCGCSMSVKYNGVGTPYYRCNGRRERGEDFCAQRYLRADDIEACVLARVKADVTEALSFDDIEIILSNANYEEQLKGISHEIDDLLKRSEILLDKLVSGHINDAQYISMNKSIQHRLTALEKLKTQAIEGLGRETEKIEVAQLIRQAMRDFLQFQKEPVPTTRQLLELLVDEVHLAYASDEEVGIKIVYRFG